MLQFTGACVDSSPRVSQNRRVSNPGHATLQGEAMMFYMYPETARALLRRSINHRQVILLRRAIAAQADAAFERGL